MYLQEASRHYNVGGLITTNITVKKKTVGTPIEFQDLFVTPMTGECPQDGKFRIVASPRKTHLVPDGMGRSDRINPSRLLSHAHGLNISIE